MMSSVQKAAASHHLGFASLLAVATLLRILVNNIVSYSPADETVYLRYARMLAGGEGYARIVRLFIDDRGMWVFPNPLRWSYLGTAALFCRSHRGLATLSTICGIAAVALTYWLGLRLFEQRTALIAAALMATSPLQLALGRRALADEFFCAMVLASLVALVSSRTALWVVLTTLAFAAKEQFLFIYPVILLFWWLRERRLRWEWLLPPFLFFAVFSLLARDLASFFRIARIVTSLMDAPYAAHYQGGPPHRLLIDFLAVAPLVTIAFIAAAFSSRRVKNPSHILLLAAGILVVHSLLSSKNLRYVVSADPLIRLTVAAWLPAGRWTTVALIGNAAVELVLFYAIFVAGNVYDPVTSELLRALRMLP